MKIWGPQGDGGCGGGGGEGAADQDHHHRDDEEHHSYMCHNEVGAWGCGEWGVFALRMGVGGMVGYGELVFLLLLQYDLIFCYLFFDL